MKSRLLVFATISLLLLFGLVSGVAAQEATGDFSVVQQAAEEYLSSGKAPVISADALWENLNDGDESNDPFIVSVRAPDAYELGHIPGAINIPWKTIAEPDNLAKLPTDQPIVIYCYTGHTGQIATTVLNLLGYDATNLKFGMMGWTEDDEVLATARYGPDTAMRDYTVETEPNEATETYDFPELSTGGADDFEIIRQAADDWIKNAEAPIVPADKLWENLNDGDDGNDPFVLSVRAPDAYEIGHVPRAVDTPGRTIADPENLAMLPMDQNITAYCYTGHTGQVAATILGMLGYDVPNMKYGMMGWTEDDEVLATARFGPELQRDYRVESSAAAQAERDDFEVVRAAAEEYLASGKAPVISADALWENLNDGDESNDPFIVSVRAPDAYELGHIPGAINIRWKTITDADSLAQLPTDRPIVAYCYTGHTGQVATTALNLLGYDATNLKFGMMGWTENDEVLATARYGPDTAMRDYTIETEPNEATETYDYPELSTGGADDFEIVRQAVDSWIKNAEAPIIPADKLWENINDGDESNDPFIVSVRAPEHYELGHVPGAVNIPWKAIADPANLALLPTDQNITTYCYTGHTGQVAATVLGALGYDVSNMKYGMMGWTEDDEVLATARFGPDLQRDYKVEGTAADAETQTTSPEPAQLPAAGGTLSSAWLLLLASGLMSLGAGLGLHRRLATQN